MIFTSNTNNYRKTNHSLKSSFLFDDRLNYKASVNDLNVILIRDYLCKIGNTFYDKFKNMNLLQLAKILNLCDMKNDSIHPKNVGLLFFSYNPEFFLPYSYIDLTIIYDQTEKQTFNKIFTGPLNIQYYEAMLFIKNIIIEEKVFKIPGQMEAKRYFNYPYEAIGEILGNAILHRSYQINEPISIRITRTEIEITSLPGIDKSISDQDVKAFKWRTRRYRNRRVSEFLKELHIVKVTNTGIPTVLRSLELNESPKPIVEMDEEKAVKTARVYIERSYLTVRLPIHRVFTESNNKDTVNMNANTIYTPIRDKLSLRDSILIILSKDSYNLTDLSKKLEYKSIPGSLKENLKTLENDGLIKIENKIYSISDLGLETLKDINYK